MSSVAKEVIKKQKIREYEGHLYRGFLKPLNSLDHLRPSPFSGATLFVHSCFSLQFFDVFVH